MAAQTADETGAHLAELSVAPMVAAKAAPRAAPRAAQMGALWAVKRASASVERWAV